MFYYLQLINQLTLETKGSATSQIPIFKATPNGAQKDRNKALEQNRSRESEKKGVLLDPYTYQGGVRESATSRRASGTY